LILRGARQVVDYMAENYPPSFDYPDFAGQVGLPPVKLTEGAEEDRGLPWAVDVCQGFWVSWPVAPPLSLRRGGRS
jgi:hypothetical protein